MAVNYEIYIRVKELATQGLNPTEIVRYLKEDCDYSMSRATVYKILSGEFQLSGKGRQLTPLQEVRIQEKIDTEMKVFIENKLKRNETIELEADKEIIKRLKDPKERVRVSVSDLVRVKEISFKVGQLIQSRPTDILEGLSPQTIIKIANLNINLDGKTKVGNNGNNQVEGTELGTLKNPINGEFSPVAGVGPKGVAETPTDGQAVGGEKPV